MLCWESKWNRHRVTHTLATSVFWRNFSVRKQESRIEIKNEFKNLQNVWERLPKNWHLLHWPLFLFCQFVLVSFSALNCYNRWPRNPLFTKFEKNSAKFNFSKKLVKLCLHFIKIVRVLDDLTNFFSISKNLQFIWSTLNLKSRVFQNWLKDRFSKNWKVECRPVTFGKGCVNVVLCCVLWHNTRQISKSSKIL